MVLFSYSDDYKHSFSLQKLEKDVYLIDYRHLTFNGRTTSYKVAGVSPINAFLRFEGLVKDYPALIKCYFNALIE
jgi:hypothetical protein